MKPVQYFSDEYLAVAKKSSPTQIAKFLDDYRSLHGQAVLLQEHEPSKLISIRVTLRLLTALKDLAKKKRVPYQKLMKEIIEAGL